MAAFLRNEWPPSIGIGGRNRRNTQFGGETPFSAEIWFINKTAKRDLRWGTKGPVQVIDPQYNYPVSVRAFGRWGMRISDARSFLVQIVGSQSFFEGKGKGYLGIEKVEDYFVGEIIQRLSDALAKYFLEKGISVFQASARINELSTFLANDIRPEFDRFGIEVVNFNVERISIPEEELQRFQEILGKRMEIEQISQAQIGQAYTAMRTFDILDKTAANEGGGAGQLLGAGLGLGVGLGAGVPIGNQVGSAMSVQPNRYGQAEDPLERLQKLKQILDAGLISQEEFEQRKETILNSV